MRMFLKSLLVFVALSIALSASFGCGGSVETAEPDGDSVAKKTDDAQSRSGEKEQVANDEGYPSPPQKIVDEEFKLLDGKTFNLKESKGKVVLINLWAIWCGPCRKEMPELVEMQEKYRDKGFEIIGLDTDPETDEEIKVFAEKMKLNYELGWASREMVSEFFKLGQMNGIPQSFLINREGKLTGMFRGGGNRVVKKMKETVAEMMSE